MFRKVLPAALLLLSASRLHSQATITVYADFQNGDSVHQAIQVLTGELRKGYTANYITHSPSGNECNGFLLLTANQAQKYKVILPKSLRSAGNEGIYIQSNKECVTLIGNTALALQEAVYLYLEQLGYRWLMPGEEWNIVPKLNTVFKKLNILTRPDYEYRWIANGHGYMNSKKIGDDFTNWATANRMPGAFPVKVGHSYDEVVLRNAEAFKQHPEYFGQPPAKGTLPAEFKFNVANKDLVDIVVKDAISRYELQQRIKDNAPMVSMEPSDGGGFCKSPACQAIGTASEQVFYLTNKVAKELQIKYPGVWTGGYAYNEHVIPPTFKLEPNVFIMIANGFNRSKYSTIELMQLWKKRVAKIGVYEYLSVYEWDNDLPGQCYAAKIDYLKRSVKKYYDNGVRAYMGESVMGWINRGLGQYILSRLLWNINVNVDSVRNDFFLKGYENTAPLISKLYSLWENYPHRIASDNDMADWLGIVNTAYNAAQNESVRKRIDMIKMYLHYLVLYRILKKEPTEENMVKTLNYAFRTFETTAFATLPTMVSLPPYTGFPAMGWYANPVQKWKEDKRPFTNAELQQLFQQDLKSIKRVEGMTAFAKADAFIKLSSIINVPDKKFPTTIHVTWDKTEYIVRINKQSDQNYIEIKSDFSAQPPVARDVEINFYTIQQGEINFQEDKVSVLALRQHIKSVEEKFSLQSLKPGTYRLLVNDQRKNFILKFSPSIDYSIVANAADKINTTSAAGLNIFYFYVPKGVKKFQVVKTTVLQLQSPVGRRINKQDNRDETFFVDVQPGEEGLWIIEQQAGTIYLEGVPPYFGDHPSRMLVPAYLKK